VLEGELDLATGPDLELELDRLERRRPGLVLVDLRRLAFVDLAGMRVLLAAHERARRRAGEFAIVRGAPSAEILIRLLALDTVLDLIDHPAEVPRSVSRRCRGGSLRAGARSPSAPRARSACR
jgi:anti-anti-sigma factor